MAGNSSRKGAVRKGKKGATVGSGGNRARGLSGKGPTPKATERKGHPAARRAAAAERRSEGAAPPRRARRTPTRRSCWSGATRWPRRCGRRSRPTRCTWRSASRPTSGSPRRSTWPPTAGLPILEVSKAEIDRRTGGILHQGIALQVPAFSYDELPDLLELVAQSTTTPLLVALDGVTDPRNLGAVIRSAVAFGAQGVILPTRRSAGVTATAWRTSAGTAARIPVAQVTNLVRALRDCQKAGMQVVGLDADGEHHAGRSARSPPSRW